MPHAHIGSRRDCFPLVDVAQLRGCVELYEGCETALTLARVMLKYFIAPGWQRIMEVWATDPDAGRLLRSCHAVAVLLECLEEPGAAGGEKDVELFRSLQTTILCRFERLLAVQPARLVIQLAHTCEPFAGLAFLQGFLHFGARP